MFKVSFKEDYKKVQTFNDKATLVTLTGELKMPREIWNVFPESITRWIWEHQGVDVRWKNSTKRQEELTIEIVGKSICADGDAFNQEIGQRIAESRAKIKLFRFMLTLCKKLMKYYYSFMYGNAELNYFVESHIEKPKDGLYLTYTKYTELYFNEFAHLNNLLEEE